MRHEKLFPPLSATHVLAPDGTLHVQFKRRFDKYRWIFLLCFLCSYNLCAVLEVIVKIEKSQNYFVLILLHSNLILCHLYMLNITKFTKKSFFLLIKVLDSYRLNFSCRNLATMIRSSCTLFCFKFCFISIYLFNNFLRANKKRRAYNQLPMLQQIVCYFTLPLLVLSGLELLAFK